MIDEPYTAAFGDTFVAVERLRLVNEGVIRMNITQLIEDCWRWIFNNLWAFKGLLSKGSRLDVNKRSTPQRLRFLLAGT
uniref:hypothetical protein n=1 Tax=Marinobacterium profundum TaxID=1714300 RepID=UPI000831975C|nr:hypothetical protein [Marinobacterium profundum]